MKIIKQPQITQTLLNRIDRYTSDVNKNEYKPWVNVRQSDTYGQGQEFYCHKTNRVHSLLSRGERPIFFFLERDPTVIEIFDQYPLPILETLDLATKLNILHPGIPSERDNHGGVIPIAVMTTDFLVKKRMSNSKTKLVAYSFKYKSALNPEDKSPRSVARTKKKLELEEAYWADNKIEFILEDEDAHNSSLIYNLEFLRECYDYPEHIFVSQDLYTVVLRELTHLLTTFCDNTLRQILETLAKTLNLELHQALCLFQKAVYEFDLKVDLNTPLELYHPVVMRDEEASYELAD
jgi:hypothetical protein